MQSLHKDLTNSSSPHGMKGRCHNSWKMQTKSTSPTGKATASLTTTAEFSPLSKAGMILARVLHNRFLQHPEQSLNPESQHGFHAQQGTVDMIPAAPQHDGKVKSGTVSFTDLTKAFDTVSTHSLCKTMEKFGCPCKFITFIWCKKWTSSPKLVTTSTLKSAWKESAPWKISRATHYGKGTRPTCGWQLHISGQHTVVSCELRCRDLQQDCQCHCFWETA